MRNTHDPFLFHNKVDLYDFFKLQVPINMEGTRRANGAARKMTALTGFMTRRLLGFSGRTLILTFFLSQLVVLPTAIAAPTGGNIVGGSGSIEQSAATTTINQLSPSLAIDWNRFDVGRHEVVNFLQPGRSSIALNRILSQNGSHIHGQINANGQVINTGLINV